MVNNNSSNSLVFGQWPQAKIARICSQLYFLSEHENFDETRVSNSKQSQRLKMGEKSFRPSAGIPTEYGSAGRNAAFLSLTKEASSINQP